MEAFLKLNISSDFRQSFFLTPKCQLVGDAKISIFVPVKKLMRNFLSNSSYLLDLHQLFFIRAIIYSSAETGKEV